MARPDDRNRHACASLALNSVVPGGRPCSWFCRCPLTAAAAVPESRTAWYPRRRRNSGSHR
ncbi:DUF6248 family natural product biosynthesis protein [Nocardia sp. CA-084685]|uniref:DUF6248 family natural product biosynthesis protein n=1 Tax=Nocardia sp. CA-084685 TaxID=3239970 RepID=UPI003D956508